MSCCITNRSNVSYFVTIDIINRALAWNCYAFCIKSSSTPDLGTRLCNCRLICTRPEEKYGLSFTTCCNIYIALKNETNQKSTSVNKLSWTVFAVYFGLKPGNKTQFWQEIFLANIVENRKFWHCSLLHVREPGRHHLGAKMESFWCPLPNNYRLDCQKMPKAKNSVAGKILL